MGLGICVFEFVFVWVFSISPFSDYGLLGFGIFAGSLDDDVTVYETELLSAVSPGIDREIPHRSLSNRGERVIAIGGCRQSGIVIARAMLKQPGTFTTALHWFMGSYKWGYKSPNMGYKYSYPTCNPTYNYP